MLSDSHTCNADKIIASGAVVQPASLRALVSPVPDGGSPAWHEKDIYKSGFLGCLLSGSPAARAADCARAGSLRAYVRARSSARCRMEALLRRTSCTTTRAASWDAVRCQGQQQSGLSISPGLAQPASLRARTLVGSVPDGGSPAGHKLDNFTSDCLGCSQAHQQPELSIAPGLAQLASLRARTVVGSLPDGGSPAWHKLDNYTSGLLECCQAHTHATLTRSLPLAQWPSQRACVRARSSARCQMEALLRGTSWTTTREASWSAVRLTHMQR